MPYAKERSTFLMVGDRIIMMKILFKAALKKYHENKFVESESLCRKILNKDTNHFPSLNLIGILLIEKGKLEDARRSLAKAIKINPKYIFSHYNMGNVLKLLGNSQGAIDSYNNVINLNPKFLNAQLNLGNIFQKLGQLKLAVNCYLKVLKIDPNFTAAHINLGIIFRELGDQKKAINHCKKAILINPKLAIAYNALGIMFIELGAKQKAINHFRKAVKYDQKNLYYLYQLTNLKENILDLHLKKNIHKLIESKSLSKENLAYANLLLSKYEFNNGNHKKEFNYLIHGHNFFFESQRKIFENSLKYLNKLLIKIEDLNFKDLDKKLKINNNLKPIFIIGVPRSGSTLIEKIIVSGSRKIPIGEEIGIIQNIFQKEIMSNKVSLDYYIENIKNILVKQYNERGLIKKSANFIFTDKSLENFFYIGLIKIIFPHAKIINCRRDPLSSIVSIIKNNLNKIAWAHNIEHIFKYFDMYFKYIKYWNDLFPDFIYDLQYEKFVNNLEIESKKLFEYCNLPWNKKCLEFYKRNDLISKTTSNLQIRNPINQDSLKKYEPYKKLLLQYADKYQWI